MLKYDLNSRALAIADRLAHSAVPGKVAVHQIAAGGRLIDCGVAVEGGLETGLELARVCTAGLAEIQLIPGELAGGGWPYLQVATDAPLAACLYSQYAGWQISVGKYFAMGSGPMRAVARREEIFQETGYFETANAVVGVLEGSKLPQPAVYAYLAEKLALPAEQITLLIAPTASRAGTVQVVARVVETALHKLHELGFDLSRLCSAYGTAPLAPVAGDDLSAIGRTNDAILYGGRVTVWVRGDDASLVELGPRVPAQASPAYGSPFLQIFEAAGRDFYKIDKHLFSPAEITFHNLDTGRVHRFGQIAPQILRQSFGLR